MCGRRLACRVLLLVALSLLALAFLSCGGDEAPASTPTGVVEVDVIIDAVERQDIEALVDLVRYQQVLCRPGTEDDYIAPPGCPAGSPDGTPVQVFMSGSCHPGWVWPEGLRDVLRSDNRVVAQAVFRAGEPLGPIEADYRVVLGRLSQADRSLSSQIGIADGGIVWLMGWCGSVLEQISSLRDAGAELIFLARSLS